MLHVYVVCVIIHALKYRSSMLHVYVDCVDKSIFILHTHNIVQLPM